MLPRLLLAAVVVAATGSGGDSTQTLEPAALAAENELLRTEVRLLRRQLLAASGAGAALDAVAETEFAGSAGLGTAGPQQRRTLKDLLPPRSSPFRKYLFLNESIFDSSVPPRHARLTFNPPANLGGVIKPDQPWEAGIYPFAQTVQFGNEIRVYYHCQGDTPSGKFLVPMLCLATSIDGRTFTKPDFGAVPFNGSKHNNIVLPTTGDVGALASWSPPGPVWLDPRAGVPADELWKSADGSNNLLASPDGIHFRSLPRKMMQRSDWNTWAQIFDDDALPSDGSICDVPGKGTPGRFVAYGRSDDPGNAQLAGYPKVLVLRSPFHPKNPISPRMAEFASIFLQVCGDLAGMRAVIRSQSIDGNHTECEIPL